MHLQLVQANAEVTPGVNLPLVNVTAIGAAGEEKLRQCFMAKPGQDIVLLGTVGLEGVLRILDEEEKTLSTRFVPAFLQQTKRLSEQLYALPWIELANQSGKVTAMQQIGEGGILAALWGLLEASGLGMEIEMSKIAIQQETVEICEFFDLNPYKLLSGGCLLIATEDGNGLVMELEKEDIPAVIIGKATDSNDRVLINEDERRFLETTQTDELYSI